MRVPSYQNVNAASTYGDLACPESNTQNKVKSTPKSKAKKKRLPYRYHKISAEIRQAKASGEASKTLANARAALGDLLKSKDSGKYNEKEIENAIAHAKKMVQCAKMKLEHLSQEEQQKQQNEKADRQDLAGSTDAKTAALQMEINMREQALAQRCRDNRSVEEKELNEADLAYLKRKMELLRQEKEEGAAAALAGDYEAAVEMTDMWDISADMGMDTGTIDISL